MPLTLDEIVTGGLRIAELAATNDAALNERERNGSRERAANDRLGEPPAF